MSKKVDHERIADELGQRGPAAFLITVGDDRVPHVTGVLVRADGGQLKCGAGRTTIRNVSTNPNATFLWPADEYALLVDGAAAVDGDELTLTPTAAVLHKVADATVDGPTCEPLDHRHD